MKIEKAIKRKVLVDSEIVIEVHIPHYVYNQGEEAIAKARDNACQEFLAFIRDHRHQDVTGAHVRRTFQDQCSACGAKWETMRCNEEGEHDPSAPEECANCGALVVQEAAKK